MADRKPPKSHSQTPHSRFPRLRGSRTPSVSQLEKAPLQLRKDDMMIKERVDDECKERDGPPAVNPGTREKFLVFRPIVEASRPPPPPNKKYFFKFLGNEVRLVRWLLEDNGFREGRKDWLLGWSNTGLRSNVYQGLTKQQKVNHFPRTSEITKKDSLFKNISKMQVLHGRKHYDFIPETFVLPQEAQELSEQIGRGGLWIVKPAGSSQGRGIFLTNRMSDIPTGQQMVASRYIANPLLINGLKFDLRVYVAVTSVDPLRVYVYNEGLVRFATQEFDLSDPSNRFVHLTNYSLNKYSPQFTELEGEGKGFKWTHTALKQFLDSQGVDQAELWQGINDIVVKTVVSIETTMNAGMKMFVPFKHNCFELLGFDILVDDTLKPWLIEVNLSPSMNTDTAIDLKVKSPLVADLFTLVGVPSREFTNRLKDRRPPSSRPAWSNTGTSSTDLTAVELRTLREAQSEMGRSGGFACVFPSTDSVKYKKFFETERPLNSLLIAYFSNAVKRELHMNQLHQYEHKLEQLRKKQANRSTKALTLKDQLIVRSGSKPRNQPRYLTLEGSK